MIKFQFAMKLRRHRRKNFTGIMRFPSNSECSNILHSSFEFYQYFYISLLIQRLLFYGHSSSLLSVIFGVNCLKWYPFIIILLFYFSSNLSSIFLFFFFNKIRYRIKILLEFMPDVQVLATLAFQVFVAFANVRRWN